MQTLEVAGKILNLPTLIRADLLARQTTARTSAFRLAQLIDMRRDRKIFEVGKIAPALATLHAAQLFGWLLRMRKIVCVDRLLIQVFGEVQQHLRYILVGLQTIRPWTVIPLLVTLQLKLHANKLYLQLLRLLALCIAFRQQFQHKRAQRRAVFRQLERVEIALRHLWK